MTVYHDAVYITVVYHVDRYTGVYRHDELLAPRSAESDVFDRTAVHAEKRGYLWRTQRRLSNQFDICRREFRSLRSSDVLGSRDGFKMLGADAVSLRAKMVDIESCGDSADLLFIDGPVGDVGTSLESDAAVSGPLVDGAFPDPAGRLVAPVGNSPEIGRQSFALVQVADVAANESHRLSGDMAMLAVGHRGYRGEASTPALAERLIGHGASLLTFAAGS